jgi:hypothetical protein
VLAPTLPVDPSMVRRFLSLIGGLVECNS